MISQQDIIDMCNYEKLYCLEDMHRMEVSFLEMPGKSFWQFRMFDILQYNIRDLLKFGQQPIIINDTTRKIELPTCVYYWTEQNETMTQIVELEKVGTELEVINARISSFITYGELADLYVAILDNDNCAIKSSKSMISEDNTAWQTLLNAGYKMSVSPDMNEIVSVEEMVSFYGKEKKCYQYVVYPR